MVVDLVGGNVKKLPGKFLNSILKIASNIILKTKNIQPIMLDFNSHKTTVYNNTCLYFRRTFFFSFPDIFIICVHLKYDPTNPHSKVFESFVLVHHISPSDYVFNYFYNYIFAFRLRLYFTSDHMTLCSFLELYLIYWCIQNVEPPSGPKLCFWNPLVWPEMARPNHNTRSDRQCCSYGFCC